MSIERMTPDQVVVAKLFEIASRLEDIEQRLLEERAKGIIRPERHIIGTEWYAIVGAWLAATIYNDGVSDIYIRLGDRLYEGKPWDNNEAPLKSGESLGIDLGAREEEKEAPTIWLICQTGTATIRIFKKV